MGAGSRVTLSGARRGASDSPFGEPRGPLTDKGIREER